FWVFTPRSCWSLSLWDRYELCVHTIRYHRGPYRSALPKQYNRSILFLVCNRPRSEVDGSRYFERRLFDDELGSRRLLIATFKPGCHLDGAVVSCAAGRPIKYMILD